MKAVLQFFTIVFLILIPVVSVGAKAAESGVKLIDRAIRAHGGKEPQYNLRDAQCHLRVWRPEQQEQARSVERYMFKDERSMGVYSEDQIWFPELASGETIHTFLDGKAWISFGGKRDRGPKREGLGLWIRKRNFFLFVFPFKLKDPGISYLHIGQKELGNQKYEVLDVIFPPRGNPTQPRIRLFIHPQTDLIESYVTEGSGIQAGETIRISFEYEKHHSFFVGIKRTTKRANWEGETRGTTLLEEKLENVQFWNGFSKDDFSSPK